MELTNKQKERYSKHILLRELGEEGQKKLINSKVLIIGAGGLGSPAAMYLTAAGIGTIGIADADIVDLTNLQRQIIHMQKNIGRAKVESAKEMIKQMNSDTNVNTYNMRVTAENIMEIIKDYDIVIDACDNFKTKFLINDACVIAEKPFIHGGILRFSGQIMTYVPHNGPCYRCIFTDVPPADMVVTCNEVGIIGAMCGVIGSLQAMEAVKYLTGAGEPLTGYLLTYDALKMEFRKVKLPKSVPDCRVCGDSPEITEI